MSSKIKFSSVYCFTEEASRLKYFNESKLISNDKNIILLLIFSAIAVPIPSAYFGPGAGPILIDEMNCNGSETNLGLCDRKPWGVNNCAHDEDAGLMCLRKILFVDAFKLVI